MIYQEEMMRWSMRLVRSLAVPLLLLGLALAFCWDLVVPAPGEGWWGPDANTLFYPFGHYVAAAFKENRLPLWNPHLFLGFPFFAEPQATIFYPVTWLFVRWPVEKVIGWSLALHVWLASVGTYAFARGLGGRETGALLSGVIAGFSGFVTSRMIAGHYVHLMTWAWVPWMFAAFHWAYRRRSWPASILAGIPMGLGLLAGFPPFWAFGLLATGLWALYLAARETSWRRRGFVLVQFGLALVAGLLLAGAQLLPTGQFTTQSSRVTQQSYEFVSDATMPVGHFLTLLVPDLFGSPGGDVEFWAAQIYFYWESCLYVGISSLLLILLLGSLRDWRWRFFLALAGGAFLVSLGRAGVVHLLLYRFLPGFGLFRVPPRAGLFFVLAVAILSGLALDRWLDLPHEERVGRLAKVKRGVLLACGLALIVALLAALLAAVQQDGDLGQRALLITTQTVRFCLLLGGTYLLLRAPWRGIRLTVSLLLLVLIDLWGFGNKFLVVEPFEEPHLGWIMADLGLPRERHAYRVFPTPSARTNDPMRFGFLSTDGYDYFVPADADVFRNLVHYRDNRILDLTSVRYLMVSKKDIPHTTRTEGWNLIGEPAGASFYERGRVGPRVFVVHGFEMAADHDDALDRLLRPEMDPYATVVLESPADCAWEMPPPDGPPDRATILEYGQEHVVLDVEAAAGGMVILGDLYYPGWQAEVDRQPAAVQRADYALRGVCVPAGRHRIVFHFDPPIGRYGIILSVIGIGVVLLAALWIVWEAVQARRRAARTRRQNVFNVTLLHTF
jgi:hypothetical protein